MIIIQWQIGEIPMVEGDHVMLQMVLANLIDTVLEFTRPRPMTRIEIGECAGQSAKVLIFVRDKSVGLDMTCAGKLFGISQRLHWAYEFEGSVAIVRRIIIQYGSRTGAE